MAATGRQSKRRAKERAEARPRRSRLPAEARRTQLLDVAAAILREEGRVALTMEGVAERAGVSKGLGYVHFENAEELLLALAERAVGELYARIEAAVDGSAPFPERLRGALRVYADTVEERGSLLGLLWTRLEGRRLRRRLRGRIVEFVSAWARELERAYALPRRRAMLLAAALLTFADTSVRTWRAGLVPRVEMEESVVRFVLAGLEASATTGPLARPERGRAPRR